jgi:hypothetical protein
VKIKIGAIFLGFVICAFSRFTFGQGILNAINFTPPGVFNQTTNGVGWSFVPTSDLLVTAISSTAPQVSFWLGTNQIVANYNYSGPYGSLLTGPSTNFQAVSSLLLSGGQTYFISTQYSNFTSQVNSFIFGLNGTNGLTPFTTSSDISWLGSYYVSQSGNWSPTISDNTDYLFLGPNFQFQPVPEPADGKLLFLTAALLIFLRAKLPKLNP